MHDGVPGAEEIESAKIDHSASVFLFRAGISLAVEFMI